MSVRNLDALFKPESIVLVGASDRLGSMGAVLLRNLQRASFGGRIDLVNPKYSSLAGQRCYRDVSELPSPATLAVTCTPPASVPDIVDNLAKRGTRAAIVITAGMSATPAGSELSLRQQMLSMARPHLMRIVGPNCLGLQAPSHHLDASFSHLAAAPGSLAFVTQSGAMLTTVLDWAQPRGIGFSHVVSLGDMADVDIGDMLDYLAADPATSAILLYIEAITHPRKFMSAARAASRIKPIVAVKAGRSGAGVRAAASHTGMLAGSDAVYDAAFRRAGILRVFDMQELFAAAETLALSKPLRGERIAILTNGGGPGVLAADALVAQTQPGIDGGTLANLSPTTIEQLNQTLPNTWSHANPVDIIGDASPQRFRDAIRALLNDEAVDALLVLNCPTAITSSEASATAVAEELRNANKPAFTCWLGEATANSARHQLREAGIPTYETPELAVQGVMHRVRYHRNQALLQELPASASTVFEADHDAAANVISCALAEQRQWLSALEIDKVLRSYGIPSVTTYEAHDAAAAQTAAARINQPCALKILSRDILHKSDVGGVALNLATPEDVFREAEAMQLRIQQAQPTARLDGFIVQSMVKRSHARELIIGFHEDPQFGAMMLFGQGGITVEVVKDYTLEFPPLNPALAKSMISRTRVQRLLQAFRNEPAADIEAIADTLTKVSQLIADIPEIVELDLNPLLADENGVMTLDVRIRIAKVSSSNVPRFAILPYPRELERCIELSTLPKVLIRPVRPEDAQTLEKLFAEVSGEEIQLRFLASIKHLPRLLAARLSQIDYDREMAFVALDSSQSGSSIIGVARMAGDPDMQRAEFALLVAKQAQRRGVGAALLRHLVDYARKRGVKELFAEVLRSNTSMLNTVQRFGFVVSESNDSRFVTVRYECVP